MSSKRPTPDVVVLGVISDSSRTHGTWIAHSRPGFIGEADALPINDTASTACPGQKSATPVAIGSAHHSVTANNGDIAPPRARFNRTTTAVVSLVSAIVISAGGLVLVALAGSVSADTGPVATASLIAAALCGLVLIVVAPIGGRPSCETLTDSHLTIGRGGPKPLVGEAAAAGGAEARPRVSVVKGNYTASVDAGMARSGHQRADQGLGAITGQVKRLLADRARALIAETCGDMPEAQKIAACGVHVRAGIEDVAIERHPNGYVYATGLQTCGSVWA